MWMNQGVEGSGCESSEQSRQLWQRGIHRFVLGPLVHAPVATRRSLGSSLVTVPSRIFRAEGHGLRCGCRRACGRTWPGQWAREQLRVRPGCRQGWPRRAAHCQPGEGGDVEESSKETGHERGNGALTAGLGGAAGRSGLGQEDQAGFWGQVQPVGRELGPGSWEQMSGAGGTKGKWHSWRGVRPVFVLLLLPFCPFSSDGEAGRGVGG